jgi:hypothetical protein
LKKAPNLGLPLWTGERFRQLARTLAAGVIDDAVGCPHDGRASCLLCAETVHGWTKTSLKEDSREVQITGHTRSTSVTRARVSASRTEPEAGERTIEVIDGLPMRPPAHHTAA